MNAYKGFVEKLNDFFKSISKEIKNGKVKSHLSLEQENDIFRLVHTEEGKRPIVKTWDIPEEDRDETMTLMKALQKHKENDIFQRLMQAIRSTRNMIHSDQVWKKNIISFMNESFTLDEFVRQLQQGASEVDELVEKIKSTPSIHSNNLHEQNIPLQNLYKTLLMRRLNQTKDVKEYDVLKQLLVENSLIHSIRKQDGSIGYQKDGEVLQGTIVDTYESLKQFDFAVKETQIKSLGEVISWRQYKLMAQDGGIQIEIGNQKIEGFDSIAVANHSVYALGQDFGEARKQGGSLKGGQRLRLAASYEETNHGIPIALKGRLYANTIKAIMSYKQPELRLGGTMEDENDEVVWSMYLDEIKAGGDRRKVLLQNENSVLIQKYDVLQSDYESVKGEKVIWMTRFGKRYIIHVYSIFENVMNRSTLVNSYSSQNASAVRNWILRNLPWQQKAKQMGLLEERTTKSIHALLEVIYGIRLDSISDSDEEVKMALDDVIEREVPDWSSLKPEIGDSLEKSLELSGFESPQVSIRELISYVSKYGDTIALPLDLGSRFSRIRNSVVLGIFLSILHPALKEANTTELEILDIKRPSLDSIKVKVGKEERDIVRRQMSVEGIDNFELPVEESSGGASERKEAKEIEDLEYERNDEIKTVTIWHGTPIDMRISFK